MNKIHLKATLSAYKPPCKTEEFVDVHRSLLARANRESERLAKNLACIDAAEVFGSRENLEEQEQTLTRLYGDIMRLKALVGELAILVQEDGSKSALNGAMLLADIANQVTIGRQELSDYEQSFSYNVLGINDDECCCGCDGCDGCDSHDDAQESSEKRKPASSVRAPNSIGLDELLDELFRI